jgi:hypothetical protein
MKKCIQGQRLADRIDIHINVPRLQYKEIAGVTPTETSADIGEKPPLTSFIGIT